MCPCCGRLMVGIHECFRYDDDTQRAMAREVLIEAGGGRAAIISAPSVMNGIKVIWKWKCSKSVLLPAFWKGLASARLLYLLQRSILFFFRRYSCCSLMPQRLVNSNGDKGSLPFLPPSPTPYPNLIVRLLKTCHAKDTG